MMITLWICLLLPIASSLSILVIFSPQTYYFAQYVPVITQQVQSAMQETTDFSIHHWQITEDDNFSSISNFINVYRADCILDMTEDAKISYRLSESAETNEVIHIIMQKDMMSNLATWTLPGRISVEDEADAARSLLQYLNWNNTIIATQTSSSGIQFSQSWAMFDDVLTSEFIRIFVPENQKAVDNLVGRIIKSSGTRFSLIYSDEVTTKMFLKSLEHMHISGEGFGYISVGTGFLYLQRLRPYEDYDILQNGCIFIIESGWASAANQNDIQIQAFVENIIRLVTSDTGSTTLFENLVEKFYDPDTKKLIPNFVIGNSKDGKIYVVGEILKSEVHVYEEIIFPGGLTDTPVYSPVSINYSYLGADSKEADNTIRPNIQSIQLGAVIAFNQIQSSDVILPKFKLNYYEINLGNAYFDEEFVRSRFLERDKYGIALFGVVDSDIAFGVLSLERELGITLPKLFGIPFHSKLGDPTEAPMFNRISISTSNLTHSYLRIMKYFNWTSALWHMPPLSGAIDLRDTFAEFGSQQGISIANKQNLIAFNPVCEVSEQNFSMYQEAEETNCRIVFIFNIDCGFFNYYYEQGLRHGDIVPMILSGILHFNSIKVLNPEIYAKIKVFIPGALILSQNGLVGEIGEQFITEFQKSIDGYPSLLSCMQYDSLYHLGYALDLAVSRGYEYEDPKTLNDDLRSIRYSGCTGKVSFDRNTNDRSFSGFNVQQYIYQEETDDFRIEPIGTYNPLSINMFSFGKFYWQNLNNTPPTNFRTQDYTDCPFPDDDVKYSTFGIIFSGVMCLVLILITWGSAILLYRWFWKFTVVPLEQRTNFTLPDMQLIFFVICECFQFIGLGPNAELFASVIYSIGTVFNLDIDILVTFQGGVFYQVLYVVIAAIITMLVLFVYDFFIIKEIQSLPPPTSNDEGQSSNEYDVQSSYDDTVIRFSQFLNPFLSNVAFIPFWNLLIEVYFCVETSGDDIQDAFLSRDCYQNCWQGEHLVLWIISILCLCVYIPMALHLRPKHQQMLYDLNILTKPLFLMIKAVFTIVLIVLNKSVKRHSEYAFSVSYIVVLILYFVCIYKIEPYNYGRMNLWQLFLTAAVIWIGLLTVSSIFFEQYGVNETLLKILLLIGWALLMLTCWIIQFKYSQKKYPALLVHPKSEKIENLLRFQFIKGITQEYATHLTARRLRYQMDADHNYISEAEAESIDSIERVDMSIGLYVDTKIRPIMY